MGIFVSHFILIVDHPPSGVRGRVVDLCKPIQRKYETAVAVVLGRNIDAIVVDEEKTAIDCIEVRRIPIWNDVFCTQLSCSTCAINEQARPHSFL